MMRPFLLFVCASLAIACGSSASNSETNTGANRASSADVNRNANAETFNTLGLNENAYKNASNSELGSLTPSGKEAREMVGKTVSEFKLWDNKKVDPRLRDLMGTDYETMKKSWNIETPIKKFGDILMMTGCEKDNCADNKYAIFMDMGYGNIHVVHIGKDTIKEWKEYRDINLPPPFAEELAAMKSRK